jgi:hypothetical protein
MSSGTPYQIYNQAISLQKEINSHNSDLNSLLSLHNKLNLPNPPPTNYNNSRLLSDQLKLQNLQDLKNLELNSLLQKDSSQKLLDSYLKTTHSDNSQLLNKLSRTILDKNQLININQRHFEKQSLYSHLLVSLLAITTWILILSAAFSFNAISREIFTILLTLSIISYLIYALYILIQVRFFRDPNFSIYRHTIDPNINVHQCKSCDSGISGNGISGLDPGIGNNSLSCSDNI